MKFDVQSKDVIHDFWVPAFRMKIDAVPGITTQLPRHAETGVGGYPVVCAELCGLGHALMRQTAHVVDPRRASTAWVAAEADGSRAAGGGGGGGGGAATDGKTLFTDGNAATGARPAAPATRSPTRATSGATGPNLDEVLKGKDAAFIKRVDRRPDKEIAAGFQPGIMPPNFGETLSPSRARRAGEVPRRGDERSEGASR